MDLVDLIKSKIRHILADNHLYFLLALSACLLILTSESDNSGLELTPREFSIPTIVAENSIPADTISHLNNIAQTTDLANDSTLVIEPSDITQSIETQTSAEPFSSLPIILQEPDYETQVKSGDNLSVIFNRAGLTPQDVYRITQSKPTTDILEDLRPGYDLDFFLTEEKRIEKLEIVVSPLEKYVFSLDEGVSYSTEHITYTPDTRIVFKEATIDESLFLAAQSNGISDGLTLILANVFSGVIDFLLDTRSGDNFNLLYEQKYLDGEFIGNGSILAAQYTNQGETFTALRYVNREGEVDFYNPEGESMRKAFLRNPVDFTRISSNFSTRRKHPILNTLRAHKGTDYAAPRGTPVVATSDGRVVWASRNGSFGKLVTIRHGDRFETKYAHLSNYANGIKNGKRVKQGDVIGYVGSTGSATGPHLHYEFLMDGVHRNSRTIHDKLPKAKSIPESELSYFKEQTQILLAELGTHTGDNQVLANNTIKQKDPEQNNRD